MVERVRQQVIDLIEKPLLHEGCELVDVVLSRYRNNWTLRLFVFSERGTTIDECARLSAVVGDIIDGTDMFEPGYTLEVSSPGLDRPLTSARDFKYRTGEMVKIEFVNSRNKRNSAEIVSVNDQEVQFRDKDGLYTVPLEEIVKATIVF